jgi:hypothetical protein
VKLTDALRETEDRENWRELVAKSAFVLPRPDRLLDKHNSETCIKVQLCAIRTLRNTEKHL